MQAAAEQIVDDLAVQLTAVVESVAAQRPEPVPAPPFVPLAARPHPLWNPLGTLRPFGQPAGALSLIVPIREPTSPYHAAEVAASFESARPHRGMAGIEASLGGVSLLR